MAPSAYLASAAVLGVLAVVAVLLAARTREWKNYTVTRGDRDGLIERLSRDTGAWRLGFILLTIAAIVVVVVTVGSDDATLYLATVGAGIVAALMIGVYRIATAYGHPHSHAVGEAIAALGTVALVTVVGWLLMTAGA